IGLVLLLGGVVLARWGGAFQWAGFLWTLFGTIMNGLLYECFNRAKADALTKCFCTAMGMGALGLAISLEQASPWNAIFDATVALYLLGFVFVGGFLYWIANLIAF